MKLRGKILTGAAALLLQAKPDQNKEQRLLAITSLGVLGKPEALQTYTPERKISRLLFAYPHVQAITESADGYRLEQLDDEKLFGLVKDRDYAFVLQKPMSATGELKPHERELLEALFEEGSETRVEASELANSFYKDLPAIKSAVFDELVEEGRRVWSEQAARPGLDAMRMRSRISEAEALLDPDGLGSFLVAEWRAEPN